MSTWWLGESDLSDEQKDVVETEPENSFLLVGPPGSGKTNILLLRANYLYLGDHPDLAVVVFTKTLQQFIVMGADRYDFPADKIVTSMRWQLDLLSRYGVRAPVFGDGISFDERRLLLNSLIREELINKRGVGAVFDAILLDEAHDYTPAEIANFRDLCRVFVASADARQKIYATPDSMSALESATDQVLRLTHHYRIGRNICRVADAVGQQMANYDPLITSCQYDETTFPSNVDATRHASFEAQAQAIVDAIGLQLAAYPDDLIGVITVTQDTASEIFEALQHSAHAEHCVRHSPDGHPAFTPDTRVCVTTIYSAKGLEFRAVHIVDAERLSGKPIELSFTGITRAKTSVHLHHRGHLPGFIERAVRAVQPPRALPNVSALFGKKGSK